MPYPLKTPPDFRGQVLGLWTWVRTHIFHPAILVPALFLASLLGGIALCSYAGLLEDALQSGARSASKEGLYVPGRGTLPTEKIQQEKTSSLFWGRSLLTASFAIGVFALGPALLQGLKKAPPILFATTCVASLTVLTSAFNALQFFNLHLPLHGVLCLGFSLWIFSLMPRIVLGKPSTPSLLVTACFVSYLILPLYLIRLWFAPWSGILLYSLACLLITLTLLHFLLRRKSCKAFFSREETKPLPLQKAVPKKILRRK